MADKVFGKARAPKAAPPTSKRMLAWEDLPSKGIYFHRNYLRRLWEEGRFPNRSICRRANLPGQRQRLTSGSKTRLSWRITK